jgi:8-oxo-dGTP diphosphatase
VTDERPWTRVAAAVVQHPEDGSVLLAQRPAGKAYAGYWEFPGGKLEPGETPRHALERELAEELGLEVVAASPWITSRYAYPHARVELNFFRVTEFRGEPVGHDGQSFAWQVPGRFEVAPLLPANSTVLRALLLPTLLGVSCAHAMGIDRFVARAGAAMAGGLRLVQLREPGLPAPALRELVARLRPVAQRHGVTLSLNGDPALAAELGLDAVHLSSARLAATLRRPGAGLVGASCHTRPELERAFSLGVDYVVVGPVEATPSHPGKPGIGWDEWARLVQPTPVPAFAIGGLRREDLAEGARHGAHGIAMIRGAWEA